MRRLFAVLLVSVFLGFHDVVISQSSSGNTQFSWAISSNNSNKIGMVNDMTVDGAGCSVLAGHYGGPTFSLGGVTASGAQNQPNAFVAVIEPDGSAKWINTIRMKYGTEYGMAIATGSDNSVYFAAALDSPTIGTTAYPTTHNHCDFFLIKYNAAGEVIWVRQVPYDDPDLSIHDIAVDAEQRIYVTGNFGHSPLTFGATTLNSGANTTSNTRAFLVKYDSAGSVLWAKATIGEGLSAGHAVTTDATGAVYISGYYNIWDGSVSFAGQTFPQPTGNEMFIAKCDKDGVGIWVRASSGPGNSSTYGMCTDAANNIYVSGVFNSSVIAFGNNTLNNLSEYEFSRDMYFVKYDQAGNVAWAKSGGGKGDDWVHQVTFDAAGDLYFSGSSASTFSLGALSFSSTSNSTALFGKISSGGQYLKLQDIPKTGGGTGGAGKACVSYDGNGNIYLSGTAYDNAEFGTITLPIGGVFVARTGAPTVAGLYGVDPDRIQLFPNPCTERLFLHGLKTEKNEYKILSPDGVNVMSGHINGVIDVGSLRAGVYFVFVSDHSTVFKILKL